MNYRPIRIEAISIHTSFFRHCERNGSISVFVFRFEWIFTEFCIRAVVRRANTNIQVLSTQTHTRIRSAQSHVHARMHTRRPAIFLILLGLPSLWQQESETKRKKKEIVVSYRSQNGWHRSYFIYLFINSALRLTQLTCHGWYTWACGAMCVCVCVNVWRAEHIILCRESINTPKVRATPTPKTCVNTNFSK